MSNKMIKLDNKELPILQQEGILFRMVKESDLPGIAEVAQDLAEMDMINDILNQQKRSESGATKIEKPQDKLLKSAFRNPPLRHGSRFSTIHSPSIFYGAMKENTVFHEVAYYNFVFSHQAEFIKGKIFESRHTLFKARYAFCNGVELEPLGKNIYHPASYSYTQRVGQVLRDHNIKGFTYPSARDPMHALNIGLFTPDALISKRPLRPKPFVSHFDHDHVIFINMVNQKSQEFPIDNYLFNGSLPRPVA